MAVTDPQLNAIHDQLDGLLKNLDKRTPLDAKIGQAANEFNLAFRVVYRALPQFEVVRGMRELMEGDTVVELISRATALRSVVLQHLLQP
jgi:hypothetical protein